MIYCSGQIPADAQGNLVEGSIADKTRASCEGLKNVIEAAGSSLEKVVKVCFSSSLLFWSTPTLASWCFALLTLASWLAGLGPSRLSLQKGQADRGLGFPGILEKGWEG